MNETKQALEAVVGWRLLRLGEKIDLGDEVLADDCTKWVSLSGWEVGIEYNPVVFVPVRRSFRRPDIPAAIDALTGDEA